MASNTEKRRIEIIANGQKVNASLKDMAASAGLLNNQLKKMTPGTKEFVEKSKELRDVRGKMAKVKDEMYGMNQASEAMIFSFGGFFESIKGGASPLKAFKGLLRGVLHTMKALIANPIGMVIAGITALVGAGKAWFNYNKELQEATRLTKQLTGLTGSELKNFRSDVQATAETFGMDFNEVLQASTRLAKNFGISYDQALRLIQDGAIQGANANGEFLNIIKEYPKQFENAGFSAEDFVKIVTKEQTEGIFSDKLTDSLKELDLRLKEQTKTARDALENAFGKKFTHQLFNNLKSSSITTKDALKLISDETKRVGVNSQQAQQLTADLFGGAGEDAGGFLSIVENVNDALSDQPKELTEIQKAQQKQLEANKELKKAWAALFDQTGGGFENLIASVKLFGTKILSGAIKGVIGFVNTLIEMHNKSLFVRGAIETVMLVVKTFGNIISTVSETIWNALSTAADLLAGVFTFDVDRITSAISKGFKKQEEIFIGNATDMVNNVKNSINNIINGEQIEPLKIPAPEQEETTDTPEKNPQLSLEEQKKILAEKAKAEREYLQKSLAAQREVDQIKAGMMQDGLAKELVMLDIKHEQEMAKLAERRTKILEDEQLTAAQRNALLDTLEEERKLREEEKAALEEEKRIESREADIERELTEYDEDLQRELEFEENKHLEKMKAQGMSTDEIIQAETDKEQAILDLHIQSAKNKLDLLVANGKATTAEAVKLKNQIMKLEEEKSDSIVALEARTRDEKIARMNEGFNYAKEIFGNFSELLGENTKAAKAAAEAQRKIQAAQIIANGIIEISGIWKNAPQGGLFAGPILAGIQTAAAVARIAVATSKIAAVRFAQGGLTGLGEIVQMSLNPEGAWRYANQTLRNVGSHQSGGWVKQPSVGIVGEAGAEWVAPNWMIASPKFADLFGYLESTRKMGRAYAEGGYTAPARAPQSAPPSPIVGSEQLEKVQEEMYDIKILLKQNLDKMDRWQQTLRVVNDPLEADEALKAYQEVDADSTIVQD